MSKRLIKRLTAMAIIVVVSCVILLALIRTNSIRALYNDFVLDNRDHFLSCEELPPVSEVIQVVDEHQDTVREIEQVKPGFVYVEIDRDTCPGKADILIMYPTHQDRLAI
jgi:hypothetical protein